MRMSRYLEHKYSAKQRGIKFLLTYTEWCSIWYWSAHWNQRGPYRGQYVMARYGDKGDYEIGNVHIVRQEDNHREAHRGKTVSAKTRGKISAAKRGVRLPAFSDEHRAKIGAAFRGKALSPKHRAKLKAKAKNRQRSASGRFL